MGKSCVLLQRLGLIQIGRNNKITRKYVFVGPQGLKSKMVLVLAHVNSGPSSMSTKPDCAANAPVACKINPMSTTNQSTMADADSVDSMGGEQLKGCFAVCQVCIHTISGQNTTEENVSLGFITKEEALVLIPLTGNFVGSTTAVLLCA